jgi:cell division initiation protein
MIDLTPLDVRKKKGDFRKGLRGYEIEEVDAFLDLVAERLEQLVRENGVLREKCGTLNDSVEHFRTREAAMNEALVSAQQLREEIRSQTEREAELLIREARSEGERLITQAKQDVEREMDLYERLRARRDRFLRAYRGFLEGQIDEITQEEERVVRTRVGELRELEGDRTA